MELKSDPKFDTINVTDIDIAFPGDLQMHTLREGVDTYIVDSKTDTLTLNFGSGGTLLFNLKHSHWFGKKSRTIRVAIAPDAPKAKEQAAHADERTPDAL